MSLLLITLIILVYIFETKKPKNKNPKEEIIKEDKDIIKTNIGEILVVKLKYEINQCRIYNETIKIKTKVALDEPLENGKTEEIIEKNATINKYLVNIYDQQEIEDKSIVYYAYILVLKVYNIPHNDVTIIDYLGKNIFNDSEYKEMKKYYK